MLGKYPNSSEFEAAVNPDGTVAKDLQQIDTGNKTVVGMYQVLLSQITSCSTSRPDNSVTIEYGRVKAVVTLLNSGDREGLTNILSEVGKDCEEW